MGRYIQTEKHKRKLTHQGLYQNKAAPPTPSPTPALTPAPTPTPAPTSIPKTGDNAPLDLWLAMILLGTICLTLTLLRSR